MAKVEELDSSPPASALKGSAGAGPAAPTGGAQDGVAVGAPGGQRGFVDSLFASVFEPGVNPALVTSMHLSFLLLLLTLGGLAFLTGGNGHVLTLMACSVALWVGMGWFVLEITRVQSQPQNQPPSAGLPLDVSGSGGIAGLQAGDEDAEVIKSEADVQGGVDGAGGGLRRR